MAVLTENKANSVSIEIEIEIDWRLSLATITIFYNKIKKYRRIKMNSGILQYHFLGGRF